MDSQLSPTNKSDAPTSYTHSESLPHTAYRESRNEYPSPITPTRQTDRRLKTMISSPDPPATCRCLQTVISVLEELENESDLIDSSGLDSVLAFHKEALAQCRVLLRCVACMARLEYPLLLVLVCEKLVNFCEKMVNEHLRRRRGQVEFLAGKNSSGNGNLGMAHHQQKLSVGKYGVDLPVEFDCILKVLMALQLKALEGLSPYPCTAQGCLNSWVTNKGSKPLLRNCSGLKFGSCSNIVRAHAKTNDTAFILAD